MLRHINEIKKIKKRHEKSWLRMKGVVAVGIGNTANGIPGIIISVQENAGIYHGQIPESIDNIPIEIKITGEIKAY